MCSEIKSKYKLKYQGGQKRQEFDKRLHSIAVLRNEVYDVQSMSFFLSNFDSDSEKVELEKSSKDLYELLLEEQNKSQDLRNQIVLKQKMSI